MVWNKEIGLSFKGIYGESYHNDGSLFYKKGAFVIFYRFYPIFYPKDSEIIWQLLNLLTKQTSRK